MTPPGKSYLLFHWGSTTDINSSGLRLSRWMYPEKHCSKLAPGESHFWVKRVQLHRKFCTSTGLISFYYQWNNLLGEVCWMVANLCEIQIDNNNILSPSISHEFSSITTGNLQQFSLQWKRSWRAVDKSCWYCI